MRFVQFLFFRHALENFIFIIIHNSQGLINWCNFGFIVEKCRKMNDLFA